MTNIQIFQYNLQLRTFKQASSWRFISSISERDRFRGQTTREYKAKTDQETTQPSHKTAKWNITTEKNTKNTASVRSAITCSDTRFQRFRSFCKLFKTFFFREVGIQWGVSSVGWVQVDARGGGRWGVQLPPAGDVDCTETGQISSKAASTPSRSQSAALQWHTNHLDHSKVRNNRAVKQYRPAWRLTHIFSGSRWWTPWRSKGPVGTSTDIFSC